MFLNKMILASLVVLIALGFVFVATPTMAATFPAGAEVPDQTWIQGQANISIIFPTATAEAAGALSATLTIGTGTTPLAPGVTLSGVLTGLTFTFDASTGVGKLEGDNAHSAITPLTLVTYTVAEAGGTSAVLPSFTVRIVDAPVLSFPSGTSIADKVLIVGDPFGETLPAAVGGVGPLTYSIVGTLPVGITFTASSRLLTGIPRTPAGRTVITYRVTDSDPDSTGDPPSIRADLPFTITVRARPTGPVFAITKVPDKAYTKGHPIEPYTLPMANTTYAVGNVTYTLTPLPTGLTFNATSRMLTGTPNPATAGDSTATYTATDTARNANSISFKITVNPEVSVVAPSNFPAVGTSYLRGQPFADITVPNATGGTGAPADYTYAVTGLPPGLMFNATEKVITGTPAAVGISTVTITATDTLGATGSDDFRITVSAAPALSFSRVILPKTYEVGKPITPDILPTGTGGIPPYTYALSGLPDGITFNTATRLLTGTPTAAQGPTDYDYIISDSAFNHIDVALRTADQVPNTVTFPFTITVTAPAGSANRAPDFGNAMIADIVATAGTAIPGRFLPEATDADGDTLTYSIVETLPTGLNFNPVNRALTGTPTTPMPQTAYTYKVDDGNGGMDTIGFFITVEGTITPPPTSDYMYWTDWGTNKIQRATLNGTHVTDHIVGLPSPYGIAVDMAGGHIYWTVRFAGSIQRANIDGSNVQTLITGLHGPIALALDVAGGHIYWTAAGTGTGSIQRANIDGSNVQTLVTGLRGPEGLALDITGQKMYWTDSSVGSIQRADLDGSNVQTLIPTGTGLIFPRGLALDITGQKMYWTDSSVGSIQRANLDGTNRETLINTDNPTGLALNITAAKMYWTVERTGSIQRADLNGANAETLVTGVTGLNRPYGIALGISVSPPPPPPPSREPLDVDGDGQVTVIDLAIVALLYGTRVPGSISFPADVNSDGVVNILDLTAVARGIDAAGGNLNKLSPSEMESAWAAAAEQAEALEEVGAAPMGFSNRPDVLSNGNLASLNVAAALADARHFQVSDALSKFLERLAETKAIPETSALLPNYPNPFNPETWIPYHLATDADVTLAIYDVRGSMVRMLTLGHQPAGVYESRGRAAYWDGKNQHGEPVASGLYFYTLTAGDFTATRKLLIAK